MAKKSSRKNTRKSKILTSKITIIMVLSLILILLIILLINLNYIPNPFSSINKETTKINAIDRCSLIVGQLIHTINDEGSCKNICTGLCEADDKALKQIEFIANPLDCNTCICMCK